MYFILSAVAFLAVILILVWLLSSPLGWGVFILFIMLIGYIIKRARNDARR